MAEIRGPEAPSRLVFMSDPIRCQRSDASV
jgi:hypothetical protein